MSIRVQCGGCGTVMNVRDDYAGTERRCPKCKGKFQVPTVEQARAAEASEAAKGGSIAGEDFDPVAFLTGEKPAGKGTAAPTSKAGAAPVKPPSKSDFDPMDVLGGGTKPSGTAQPVAGSQPSPAAVNGRRTRDDFDPMAVLGAAPTKPAASLAPVVKPPLVDAPKTPPAVAPTPPPAPAPTPPRPEKPQPRKPSWAKSAPEPEKNDWDDPPPASPPVAETSSRAVPPEKPQPNRPSWAKSAPVPEQNDWDDPPAPGAASTATPAAEAAPTPPQPKRPAWAKPLPGETPPVAGAAAATAADASPAAKAAAEAMAASVATVSGDNPLLKAAEPKRPWIDPPAIAYWFRCARRCSSRR